MDFIDSVQAILFTAKFSAAGLLEFHYCNHRIRQYFGISPFDLKNNSELLLNYLCDDHQQKFQTAIYEAITHQKDSELEFEIIYAPESSVWMLLQVTPYGDLASGVITDISANYAAKTKAISTTQYFMYLLEQLPDRFYYKDRNSVFMGGNRAWYTHHGFNQLNDIIGKSDADSKVLSAELKQELLTQEQEMMRTGIPVHAAEHYVDAEGREFYTDSKKVPLFNDQQEIIGLVGLTRDITEQVKTEKALAKAKEDRENDIIATRVLEAALRDGSALLHALNLHAIVSVSDQNGNIVEVNDAFCVISGYNRDELIGKDYRIINSGFHSQRFWQEMWSDIVTGKPWRSPVCNRTKKGGRFWLDTFIAPFKAANGEIEKYITICTDITAVKLQEASLRNARDQLKKAADVVEMGIWTWDLTTDEIVWDERMYLLYETPAEVRGTGLYYDSWRSRIHPDDVRFTITELKRAVEEADTYNSVFRIITTQGNIRYIQAAGFVTRDAQGKAIHMMGTNRDITPQYEAEDVLRKAKQAAEDANNAKSEFLANMSHELRTPMNAILGMLTLLKKTELSARQIDYIRKTEGAARSLLGLLNDILDLSKAEAGKMTLDPHVFSIDHVLRDLSVILSTNIGNKPLEVLFDLAQNVPRQLVGDSMRLQQILLNLGTNAIKFTERGEVVLSITAQQQTDAAVTLLLSVRDTGIGIAPENQARIFSGFTQAETSTTRRFGGTGLGLAISQRMVGLMGGQLELSSVYGQGSCFYFTITLPLADPKDLEETMVNAPAAPAENALPWRVLVVDDNPAALEILGRMAESLGWTVDLAGSGSQAIVCIQKQAALGQAYQAVFVDWQMPGMDGWQTSQRIRELGIDASPVVVMVTAYDREMLAKRNKTDQVLIDGFLVKPVTASMLLDAVTDARDTSSKQYAVIPHK